MLGGVGITEIMEKKKESAVPICIIAAQDITHAYLVTSILSGHSASTASLLSVP